jgi:predicted transposase/invertase (TIGR01784 family)
VLISFTDSLPLNSERLQRVYLDQLAQPSSSLGLGIIQLVSVPESQAPQQAQFLLNQVRQDIKDAATQANIIELVEKIIIYKFPKKSRQELEQMFDLTDWKQTQFYKDVKLEGKLEGKLEIVRQLLQRGMTLAEVVSLTGLSEQELQQGLSTESKMNGHLLTEN